MERSAGMHGSGRQSDLGEGFYRPDEADLPFDLERVLRSLVRVPARHQYAAVTVFETQQEKAAFLPEQGSKVFLPEGAVLWQLALTRADLDQIRAEPGLRLRPLLFEAVQAFEGVDLLPAQRIVPLQTAALGFFISPDGRFLTNYHVMGEEIEAAGRTGGSSTAHHCRFTSFEVPVVNDRRITAWEPLQSVNLLRNPSRQDWKDGFDAALLQANAVPSAFLTPSERRLVVGEEVWVFGLPVRSSRPRDRRQDLGYEDADGTLRVSRGRVIEIRRHNFLTDADSFNGYSGGPVLDANGTVLGINWNVYPHTEVDRRAVFFDGGSIHVVAAAVMDRLGVANA